MNRRIFLSLFPFSLFAKRKKEQIPPWVPAGFHRTTRKEKQAEFNRQLRDMNAAGVYGDPPISMGIAFYGSSIGHGRTPGVYTDGRGNFLDQFWIYVDGQNYDVTEKQYNSLYKSTRAGPGMAWLEFDQVEFDRIVELARHEK